MPAVELARVVQSFAAWMYLVTFWYDGEPFDYVFEVGTPVLSPSGALAVAKANGHLKRAREAFLRDVHLETEH